MPKDLNTEIEFTKTKISDLQLKKRKLLREIDCLDTDIIGHKEKLLNLEDLQMKLIINR